MSHKQSLLNRERKKMSEENVGIGEIHIILTLLASIQLHQPVLYQASSCVLASKLKESVFFFPTQNSLFCIACAAEIWGLKKIGVGGGWQGPLDPPLGVQLRNGSQ
jgi:hypothetical protein